jgi:hypothetical protein
MVKVEGLQKNTMRRPCSALISTCTTPEKTSLASAAPNTRNTDRSDNMHRMQPDPDNIDNVDN